MKLTKWIIAGVGSYVGSMWIAGFWLNLLVSTALWFAILYILDIFWKNDE